MKKTIYLFILCFTTIDALQAQLTITEINYSPLGIDDTEYIEFYNNSDEAINLEGFKFDEGVSYTFPEIVLEARDFLVLTRDSVAMARKYGVQAYQWRAGSLSNSGEAIILIDGNTIIDEVNYGDDNSWSKLADGFGYSLILCDVNADNNIPENWDISSNPAFISGTSISYGSPDKLEGCIKEPSVHIPLKTYLRTESSDNISISVLLENGNGIAGELDIEVNTATSTVSADDYTLVTPKLIFDNGRETQTLDLIVQLKDDAIVEATESIILKLNPANNLAAALPQEIEIRIFDNDVPLDTALVLVGVYDADPTTDKSFSGIELYARKDITDLSKYSVGFANNGGGTDGMETVLPSISVSAGDFLYITTDSIRFFDFFGFYPILEDYEAFVTGDDAIELFENGQVIDIYGEINVDGTNTLWEYDSGWAIRLPNTGPDGNNFVLNNWIPSIELLTNGATNETSTLPYPLRSYFNDLVSTKKILSSNTVFNVFPNPASDVLYINLKEEFTHLEIHKISFSNTLGQLVWQQSDEGRFQEINIQHLMKGMYYLKIKTREVEYITPVVID